MSGDGIGKSSEEKIHITRGIDMEVPVMSIYSSFPNYSKKLVGQELNH